MIDFMTVLTSANNIPLTKQYSLNDKNNITKTAFQNEWLFHSEARPINGLDDIELLLSELANDRYKAVIRGKRKEGVHTPSPRRSKGDTATFEPCKHRWLCADFDSIPYDELDIKNDPKTAIEFLKEWLPDVLRRECVFRFSSSQSVPLNSNSDAHKTIRAHLYFWLDESLSDEDAKYFFDYHDCPVDLSLFNAVQLHYTADPIFVGIPNPVEKRIGRC